MQIKNVGAAMHFIYYINRLNSHESRFNLFGLLNQQYTAYMFVARLERMTTGSAVSALSYRATQIDDIIETRHSIRYKSYYT